jgi:hypothetical protein
MNAPDDDTVPTHRAAADPLIIDPVRPTGHTGSIERPGEGIPWWFIPSMLAVGLTFVVAWALIADSRADDGTQTLAEGSMVVQATSAPTTPPTTEDPALAVLPDAGFVRLATGDYPIRSRCEVHLPYEPADSETQVSSYFFFDDRGERGLVERFFVDGGDAATRWVSGTTSESSEVADLGEGGAFTAEFVGGPIAVNPGQATEPQCADRVVTNAPAQFVEPHTQIVLDVCVQTGGRDGTTISGLLSEQSRFEILQAGGELAEIVYERGPDDVLRTTAPATILRTDGVTSASGVVSNGIEDLDITIDIGTSNVVDGARTCTESDRL